MVVEQTDFGTKVHFEMKTKCINMIYLDVLSLQIIGELFYEP